MGPEDVGLFDAPDGVGSEKRVEFDFETSPGTVSSMVSETACFGRQEMLEAYGTSKDKSGAANPGSVPMNHGLERRGLREKNHAQTAIFWPWLVLLVPTNSFGSKFKFCCGTCGRMLYAIVYPDRLADLRSKCSRW